jgi:hypothetical protein
MNGTLLFRRLGQRKRRVVAVCGGALLVITLGCAPRARADEIRLKDGNKLYGVIVSYEDNMFKVKTPFGYVLVEKDKIAEIVPSTIGAADTSPEAKANAKRELTAATKSHPATKAPREAPVAPAPASAAESDTPSSGTSLGTSSSTSPVTPTATEVSEKTPDPAAAKREKTAAILANASVKPQVPAATPKKVVAPALRATGSAVLAAGAAVNPVAAPVAPKEPDALPEEIRGNLYINRVNSFTLYNESTLLVVGKEKNKEVLEPAAAAVERRVREVYDNYRQISRRTTTVDGFPGIEYHFRGMADDHDWSGTLVVLARNGETFTILGMTYADTDLIQIQENVITRSIASLKFTSAGNL